MRSLDRIASGMAALAGLVLTAMINMVSPAAAHPHVWVSAQATVVYENGKITGIRHRWSFDEMYSAMAITGLDTNNDGIYSREELNELAKVNMDGLEELGYYTFAKLGSTELKFKKPTEFWHEVDKDGLLYLTYILPLAEPVLAEAPGFNFAVYDPSFFIAFTFVKDEPISLSGAPAGCKFAIAVPEKDAEDLKRLNEAFAGQLTAGNQNAGTGVTYSKTINVSCPKG